MSAEREPVAEGLRRMILSAEAALIETDRANLSMSNLSFQSRTRHERHVWIDTQMGQSGDGFTVDLEDWTYEGTWDNAVATVDTESDIVACDVSCSWLRGDPLEIALRYAVHSTVERK
jgi:hypothetical protein